jgi:2,4-dichlorophenol 6-monooxygenase
VPDGHPAPVNDDMDLHYCPTTSPGARLPHAWVYDRQGRKLSTLDLTGHGQFTLVTGIGGAGWVTAAAQVGAALGLPLRTVTIGPRADVEDHVGDWHHAREITDTGCVLVRPDHHVAWRAHTASADPAADLTRALTAILGRN